MAGVRGKIPMGHRILISSEFSGTTDTGDADMEFGFFQDGEGSIDSASSCTTDFDDEEEVEDADKKKAFWELQHQTLHATLSRTSSLESKIRHATKEALKESQLKGAVCVCGRSVNRSCRNCLRRDVSDRLRSRGYECGICKSKWKSSPNIPAGEHTYLDVVDNTNSNKGEVRVVIELNFRAEFEMARASDEYNRLISGLPEVFVGKPERLHASIKILCAAAKKCTKENKMHLGPWRKHKYMQAMWFSTSERIMSGLLPKQFTNRPVKPRASLLTFDLLDTLPKLQHCTAVTVL